MFSLSHLAVVAIVVAGIVAAWKFERRGPQRSHARAQPKSITRQALKLMLLVVLVVGALTPALGFDETAPSVHVIHGVCTFGLAVLAYLWLFRRGDE